MNLTDLNEDQREMGASLTDNRAWSQVIEPVALAEAATAIERLVRNPTEADAAYVRGIRFVLGLPQMLTKQKM